jgi:Cu(I)/Ag(I) efflux system membrane fusion protein
MVIALGAGLMIGSKMEGTPFQAAAEPEVKEAGKEILYWVAPMDPEFRRDKPGKSPMGMDLVPVYKEADIDDGAVSISPVVENNLGVRTETAKVRPLWRRIEATGYVGFDETRISHVNTRVEGWIISLKVDAEGERVSRGDLLFEFYSPELVNAQREYLQFLNRGESLMINAAGEKLRVLGMIPADIKALAERGSASENIKIIAPQDGIVTSLSVREGMYVQPNTKIMSLADLTSVWLQAGVYESQADWVAPGQAAEARFDYLSGDVFSGQVDYVYPVLDPVTRNLRVRLRFDNPGGRLKPNMYARVSIYGKLKPNALSIPREALIKAPDRDRVVVSEGDGKFHVQEVMTGMESGEFVEILAGIAEGDEIVTSAQFLIDSEASITGSIKRLESVTHLPEEQQFEAVFGSGWIDDVEIADRRIRISHGPIDALGWPSMTMIFDVRPDVDLRPLKDGQHIRFALVQEQAGEYVVERIYSGENEADGMSEVEAPVKESVETDSAPDPHQDSSHD